MTDAPRDFTNLPGDYTDLYGLGQKIKKMSDMDAMKTLALFKDEWVRAAGRNILDSLSNDLTAEREHRIRGNTFGANPGKIRF